MQNIKTQRVAVREKKVKRAKRAVVKKRLKSINVALPSFSGWAMICTECVLADVAKSVGQGIDKRMLRMLCCVYELYKVKEFTYIRELTILMGMDTKTVQRLISVMIDAHLLVKLPTKRRVAEVKTEVYGWTMTGYSMEVISDIHSSYRSLTMDLKDGRSIVHRKIRRMS